MAVTVAEVELVARLRERNEEAFHLFVEAYAPRIRRWAGRMVTDPIDIQDITQEVLLASWRTAANLRADTVLAPWLKTITDNACRMRARRMARKPAVLVGLVPNDSRGTEPTDVAQTVAVEAALGKMPEREATILRLLYAEDRSLEEAAGILDVSTDAAKSLAARARRRFRSHFDGWFRGLGAFAYSAGRIFDFAERVPRDAVRAGVAAVVVGTAATVASVVSPPMPHVLQPRQVTVAPSTRIKDASSVLTPLTIPAPDKAVHPSGPQLLWAGAISWMQSSNQPATEAPQEWYDWAVDAFNADPQAWTQWWSAWTQPSDEPRAGDAGADEASPSAEPSPSVEPSAEPAASTDPDASASAEASAAPEESSAPADTAAIAADESAPSSTPAPSEAPAASAAPAPSPAPSSKPASATWRSWFATPAPAAAKPASTAAPSLWKPRTANESTASWPSWPTNRAG